MKLGTMLKQIERPDGKKLPSYKKVKEMNSKVVLTGECGGITVTVYQSGYITCVNEYGDATVFTETVKLTTEDLKTTVIHLSELGNDLDAIPILSSLGCSRIEHNRSVRTQKKEKAIQDDERNLELAKYDTYSYESEAEAELLQSHNQMFKQVYDKLTDAQKEVADMLMMGYKKKQIQSEIELGRTTVNDRIEGIRKKFKKQFKHGMYRGNGGWCRF